MTSTRRLWIYGLLLLLSALGVGALALGLLAREQARLASSEQSARDARAAAVADRARIIAENIELLVGDVQNALMTTLREAPAGEPRPFLTEWQTYNPLVRDVFRATAEGRPVWGAGGESLRAWLVSTPWRQDEDASQIIVARADIAEGFGGALADQKPQQQQELQARAEITQNVVQYQSARRSLEEVAKVKSAPSASRQRSSSSYAPPPESAAEAESNEPAPAAVLGAAAKPKSSPAAPSPPPSAPERFGWAWALAADGPHRFGWRELPDRTVIGLELRLEAIKARLGEVFPTNLDAGETYQLRDAAGQVWHGQPPPPSVAALLTVPLSGDVLPGWTIAAYLDDLGYKSSADGGLLVAGAALVALLVGAILLSGALLLWQARRSEAEAAQKTSFVANVSHEFKTPLTTIRLYSELLAEGRVRDEGKRTDYLRTIGSETQRLARLVGNVLDFSRLEQGRKQFDCRRLDVAAELHALLDAHAPRLAEAGLRLQTELPDESCPLVTDRDALQQIVLNLLDNACKYAAEGGEVGVSLNCDAGEKNGDVTIRVSDRGPGVPAGQRERIFEKFHRIDDRLTTAHAGTGLGLSIARQLARGLGGDLRCVARDGGGAEFVLTLRRSLTANGRE